MKTIMILVVTLFAMSCTEASNPAIASTNDNTNTNTNESKVEEGTFLYTYITGDVKNYSITVQQKDHIEWYKSEDGKTKDYMTSEIWYYEGGGYRTIYYNEDGSVKTSIIKTKLY